jgi:MFS family permease
MSLTEDAAPGRTAVAAVALAGVGAFLNLYATQPILPLLASDFSASKAAVGMTVSAATIGVALSAPFWGMAAERSGRRRIIVAAMFLLSLPTLLAATAGSLRLLVLWRFLQGCVMPGVFGVTIAYIAEEWPGGRVAAVMSIYVSGTVLGGFLGRAVTGWAAAHAHVPGTSPGWPLGFVVLGLCDLAVGILLALYLPGDRRRVRPRGASPMTSGMLSHLRNRQMLATCAVGFTVLFFLVTTFTYIPFHLATPPFSLGPGQLGSLFAVYLVGIVVTPVSGPWIARIGSRKALMAAILAAMAGVSLTLLHSIPLILLGLVLCSSGVFVCQAASSSYIHAAAPAGERASAAGLYVCCYYLGGTFAGVLPGFFWNLGGWTACVLLVLAAQATTMTIAGAAWRK